MLLKDKVALVTGGARGIGLAIVERFAEEGARVMIGDIAIDEGAACAQRLAQAGYPVRFSPLDVTDAGSITQALDAAIKQFGGIDILVNNAGINSNATVIQSDPAEWRQVLEVNLVGAYLCSKIVAAHMAASQRGESIIFLSSQAGKRGEAGASAYAASKFGLLGLMQCLALELAPHGIRVNAVCPGNVDTPMLDWLINDSAHQDGLPVNEARQALLAALLKTIPVGRLASPQEIANVVIFLASPLASYMTGESINVDGGQLSG